MVYMYKWPERKNSRSTNPSISIMCVVGFVNVSSPHNRVHHIFDKVIWRANGMYDVLYILTTLVSCKQRVNRRTKAQQMDVKAISFNPNAYTQTHKQYMCYTQYTHESEPTIINDRKRKRKKKRTRTHNTKTTTSTAAAQKRHLHQFNETQIYANLFSLGCYKGYDFSANERWSIGFALFLVLSLCLLPLPPPPAQPHSRFH